jgi:hypothetical protein
MTAHAATIVAAPQVSDRIKDYGSYAGYACVLGLGVLSLLYFAQAREVKRLREWAGRAPERDAELQARVAAEAQQRAAAASAAPAKPASAAATPAGQAVSAKPAAAPAASPGQQPAAPPQPGQQPAAQPAAAPSKPGVPAPATAAAAAAGAASASPPSAKPDAAKSGDGASPPPSTPTPATPAGASPSNGAVEQPTQITPAPAASAQKPAPKPGQPLRPPPPAPAAAADEPEHSPLRVTLMIVGGVVAVVAIVVVLVLTVFSGGDDKKAPNTIGSTPAGAPQGSSKSGTKTNATKTEPVSRGDVTVAVLNGTTVPGLARSAATKLQTAGFKIGNVTNAPDQARSATVVAYQPGHQAEARVVARLIGVGTDAIKQIDQSTAVVAGQEAFVVVTVGADQSQ